MLTKSQPTCTSRPYFDANKKPHPVGTKIRLDKLAQTHREIARDPLSFYNGTLADDVVADLTDEGKNIHVHW